jgi:hypothetical protein
MNMNDKELDQLLASASKPQLPAGFNDRLLQRLNTEAVREKSNVITFPPRVSKPKASRWPTILPLAASLAAALVTGLYLGIETDASSLFSSSSSLASVDDGDFTGFEDLDLSMQDGQS